MEQYFSHQPTIEHHEQTINYHMGKHHLILTTDNGVFSKGQVDFGSKVLVEAIIDDLQGALPTQILELGSGYGPVALMLAKLLPGSQIKGVEINQRAFDLSQKNAQNNHLSNVTFELADATQFLDEIKYHLVVTNPPIRAGKRTIQAFVDQAANLLEEQGSLYVVIQKKQGAPSMEKHMRMVFGNAEKLTHTKGYWILKSIKI